MATIQGVSQNQGPQSHGIDEIQTLRQKVCELEEKCARIQNELNEAVKERDQFRTAYYDEARTAREFADLDIEELKAMTAGPVETIE